MSSGERFRHVHNLTPDLLPRQPFLLQRPETRLGRRAGIVPQARIEYVGYQTGGESPEDIQQAFQAPPRNRRERQAEATRVALFKKAIKEFSKPPHKIETLDDGTKITHHIGRFVGEIIKGDKVHRELGASAIAGAAFWLPFVGPGIVGTINFANTMIEVKDLVLGKGSVGRLIKYAGFTIWEYGLIAGPQAALSFLQGIFGWSLAGISRFLGGYAGNAIGFFTGFRTNTTFREFAREREKEQAEFDSIRTMRNRVSQGRGYEVASQIQNPQDLRNNINQYIGKNGEITELLQLRVFRESVNRDTGNIIKKGFGKALDWYYGREIQLEEIRQSAASEMLKLLDDLRM